MKFFGVFLLNFLNKFHSIRLWLSFRGEIQIGAFVCARLLYGILKSNFGQICTVSFKASGQKNIPWHVFFAKAVFLNLLYTCLLLSNEMFCEMRLTFWITNIKLLKRLSISEFWIRETMMKPSWLKRIRGNLHLDEMKSFQLFSAKEYLEYIVSKCAKQKERVRKICQYSINDRLWLERIRDWIQIYLSILVILDFNLGWQRISFDVRMKINTKFVWITRVVVNISRVI